MCVAPTSHRKENENFLENRDKEFLRIGWLSSQNIRKKIWSLQRKQKFSRKQGQEIHSVWLEKRKNRNEKSIRFCGHFEKTLPIDFYLKI